MRRRSISDVWQVPRFQRIPRGSSGYKIPCSLDWVPLFHHAVYEVGKCFLDNISFYLNGSTSGDNMFWNICNACSTIIRTKTCAGFIVGKKLYESEQLFQHLSTLDFVLYTNFTFKGIMYWFYLKFCKLNLFEIVGFIMQYLNNWS